MRRFKYMFICVCGYVTGGTLATCPNCDRSLQDEGFDNGFGGG